MGCLISVYLLLCWIALRFSNKMIYKIKPTRTLQITLLRNSASGRPCTNTKLGLEDIPGPKIYPIIGSLYKYWPILEKLKSSISEKCYENGVNCKCRIFTGLLLKLVKPHSYYSYRASDYNADKLDKNAWLNWRRYGGLVREYPIVNLLHIYEPELMEIIFRQNDRYPARRSHIAMSHYRLSKPKVYNSGGLLSTNGPEWWRLRSTFQKIFSGPQNAKKYVKITDKVVTEFVQWIKDNDHTSPPDFLPYLNRLNLEVIGAVAFNERFNSFSAPELSPSSRSSKIIAAAFGSNSGIMKLDKGVLWKLFETPLYRKLAKSQEYLEKVSMDILLEKLNFYQIQKPEVQDPSPLENCVQQDGLDMKDIIGMMVDILMAGVDTTSYTTSFALYHIARNPECQEKLFKEASSLLPNENSNISTSVLSKTVYLKSCVKESLRLNPVSIGVGRVLQNDVDLKGYNVPAGTVVVTQNMVASRLPQYVQSPLSYKPERWLRASPHYEEIHPFLSLPFGFGPRSCIAKHLAEQNMCITLLRIIRNYEIGWLGGELGVKTLLINKPDKPISLKFIPRLEA